MLSPTEDIRTITELKKNSLKIAEQVHRTGRPVIVTVNGKPDLFLLDIKDYKYYEEIRMRKLLEPSIADVKAGRVRPMREAVEELRRKIKRGEKISRSDH